MPDEGINARVSQLFWMLPGVRVVWLQPNSLLGCVRFGLQVTDVRILNKLVHLAGLINVSVHVAVDWGCDNASHDDPLCLRYDFQVPVGPDDQRLTDLENLLAEITEELATGHS